MHSHQVRDIEPRDHRQWSVDTLRGANNGSGFDSTVADLLQSVLGRPRSPTSNSYSSRRNFLIPRVLNSANMPSSQPRRSTQEPRSLSRSLRTQRIGRGTLCTPRQLQQVLRRYLDHHHKMGRTTERDSILRREAIRLAPPLSAAAHLVPFEIRLSGRPAWRCSPSPVAPAP
jgi:hypothetical protein